MITRFECYFFFFFVSHLFDSGIDAQRARKRKEKKFSKCPFLSPYVKRPACCQPVSEPNSQMSIETIVTDDIVSRLIGAGPQKAFTPEALEFIERVSGLFQPPPELLRKTIDAVFWASLSEEEGKPAVTRVLFGDIRDPYCRLQPCEITPDVLCKLSPLLDVNSNALLIRRDGKIVGLGQWKNRDVGIVAHRPGRLAVLDGSAVLGVFERGNWVIVGGSRSTFSQIL